MGASTDNVFHGNADKVVMVARADTIVNNYGTRLDSALTRFTLPAAPAPFVDRVPQVRFLDETWERPREPGVPAIVLMRGLSGIGRRSLALRWAHDHADDFPDGRFFLDLPSVGGRGAPSPDDLLAPLLRASGVPEDAILSEGAIPLWLRATAAKRVLLVLNGIELPGQLAPFLPPSNTSMVIAITDRDPVPLLRAHGCEDLPLSELEDWAGRELLRTVVGPDPIDAEPDAVEDLLRLCEGHPETLRLAAAQLQAGRRGVGAAVRRLRRDLAGNSVIVTLGEGAYESLPQDAQIGFAMLGLHPAADDRFGTTAGPVSFVPAAAAALLGTDEDSALDVLEILTDHQLLRSENDRFHMPDRIRRHAHAIASERLSEAERDAAVRRAIEWYLTTAAAADRTANPYRPVFGTVYDALGASPFGTKRRALNWLQLEHPNLCAAAYASFDRGWHDLTVQLCEAQWALQLSSRPYGTFIPVLERGLEAAEALDDPRWLFRLTTQLGRAYYETRQFAAARSVLARARDAALDTGDPLNLATAEEFMGRAYLDAGDYTEARPYVERARSLEEQHNRPRGVAINLHHLARISLGLGDWTSAIAFAQDAGQRFVNVRDSKGDLKPDHYNQGRTLFTLGQAQGHAGRPTEAVAALTAALEIMRDEDRPYQQAEILEALSRFADPADRATYRAEAIAAYDRVHSERAARLREELN
ncbi:tetratricopeptide repeat protein [Actinomadura rupiterrae]|uniref:tetratricopeptide repeat protein n=1 Tax=Actinomadura rupiterrae TaxID=559627 RepID=UPI0020A566F3|nr:tetratricopeptide repeat protein [Actinomadura rupiterrae]MCP2339544.1 tetratricopeptide (TPR) repeat protein [Actinomadura rupiterrae]